MIRSASSAITRRLHGQRPARHPTTARPDRRVEDADQSGQEQEPAEHERGVHVRGGGAQAEAADGLADRRVGRDEVATDRVAGLMTNQAMVKRADTRRRRARVTGQVPGYGSDTRQTQCAEVFGQSSQRSSPVPVIGEPSLKARPSPPNCCPARWDRGGGLSFHTSCSCWDGHALPRESSRAGAGQVTGVASTATNSPRRARSSTEVSNPEARIVPTVSRPGWQPRAATVRGGIAPSAAAPALLPSAGKSTASVASSIC